MGLTGVGQIEKKTQAQARAAALFRDTLDYACLGNWINREDKRDIEPDG